MAQYLLSVHTSADGAPREPMTEVERQKSWPGMSRLEDEMKSTGTFLTKEAVRLRRVPPLPDLMKRYAAAGGGYYVCPICFNAERLDEAGLIAGAELQRTVPLWNWIGEEPATTFSY